MITTLIQELIAYGLDAGLITADDRIYTANRLLELFSLTDDGEIQPVSKPVRPLCRILDDMLAYALEAGLIEDDTTTMKDLFDTKIMGLLTPPPSVVRRTFRDRLLLSVQPGDQLYPQRPDRQR